MSRGLIVSAVREHFSDVESGLIDNGFKVCWSPSAEKALKRIATEVFDLVITDEKLPDMTGLELIKKLIAVNPMTDCAAVSSLTPEAFHEASEGLGILMALPPYPDLKDTEQLIQNIEKIRNIEKSHNRVEGN
jgi:DNA-binding NtrC family response regulator